MPKISVIVPIFNMQKCMQRCIDSVLAQSYTDFEVLLVDDGSTDCSGIICEEYAQMDSRVRVFHKPNGGLSSARNCGMDNALGEWITFCDPDDYVFPDWLENYNLDNVDGVQLIQQGAETDEQEFYYHGRLSSRCGFDYQGGPVGYILNLSDSKVFGYTWMKAYKTDIIRENNLHFDERIKLKEDEVFLFKYLSFVSEVRSFDRQGYFYYVPNWNNKYSSGRYENAVFQNAYCDAFLNMIYAHGYDHRLSFYSNSMIDEQMKLFAFSPNIECFRRIRHLIDFSYEESKLFGPLKWIIRNDQTCIFSYIGLLAHSVLRRVFDK